MSQQQMEGFAATIRQLSKTINDQRPLLQTFERRLTMLERALGIAPQAVLAQPAAAAVAAPAPASAPRPAPVVPVAQPIRRRPGVPVIRSRTTATGAPLPIAAAPAQVAPAAVPGVDPQALRDMLGGLVETALASILGGLVPTAGAADAGALEVAGEPAGALQGAPHTPSASDTSWLQEESGGAPVPPIVTEVQTASVSHPR